VSDQQTQVVKTRIPWWFHLICLAFATIGCLMVADGQYLIGALCTLFFGGGWIAVLIQSRGGGPALVIEPEGIRVNRPAYFLRWEEIAAVGTFKLLSTEMIGFQVHDPEAVWARVAKNRFSRWWLELNAQFGYHLYVNAPGLRPGVDAVVRQIEQELRARRK
jgi:hypothetical protein